MFNRMLVPAPCQATQDNIPIFPGYEWIKLLPNKKIYFALFQIWPNQNLPSGYDYYIVSFHLEAVDIVWLKKQKVTGPIFVLFDGNHYDLETPGVHFIPFYYWHRQLQQMQSWFGVQEKTQPKYKFSAVCNRISQSKIWIVTKLLETAKSSSMIVLNSWFDEKNVHGWQLTGNHELDRLTQTFQNHYFGQEIKIDNFDNSTDNRQATTATPWQPLYQECAIHFTNESFHYSQMYENENDYIWPGPFITEKTLKCLLGGTAMIPVGQFETYKTLTNLGLQFDYDFDISWDSDSGNLTRSTKIVNLIDRLNEFEVEQLTAMTQDSNKFNQNYIVSGQFFNQCQKINNNSIQLVYDLMC
jgi:hypothetical protein